MSKTRLEAFSDGVIAILITIMVLELKVPHGSDLAALVPLWPVLLTYALSFVYVGIYWNNHHHMLHASDHIDGRVLWANLHLLFWLSLVPFVTGWMGENHFDPLPTAAYGVVMLATGVAYLILQKTLLARHDRNHRLRTALGRDLKGKLSAVLYTAAVPLAFIERWLSFAIYVTIALVWFIPDRRIEAQLRS